MKYKQDYIYPARHKDQEVKKNVKVRATETKHSSYWKK